MKPRHPLLAALAASAGLALRAGAQLPATPSPLPPPGAPLGIAPHPAVPSGPTIWSKLGISQDQREYCRRKICRTPLGQLLNNASLPLQGLTGGLIPPFCPVGPSIAELADPGAVGAAAKIKLDEAGAKERRAAVRYLGTVDCHYWPEAEEGLIGALRGDRNECVRFEAALALANGCCCTKKTIEALTIVVSCSNRDGAPKENSHRVWAAAQAALNHCIACYGPLVAAVPVPVPPPPEGRPVAPPESLDRPPETLPGPVPVPVPPAGPTVQAPPTARPTGFQYYARIAQMPLEAIVAEARRVAALHPPVAKPEAEPLPPGERSLVGLVNYVVGRDAPAPALPPAPAPAQAGTPARPAVSPSRPTNLMALLAKPAPMAPAGQTPAAKSTHAEKPPKLFPMETGSPSQRNAADLAAPSTFAPTNRAPAAPVRSPAPPTPAPTATNQPPAAAARAPAPPAPAPVVWSGEPSLVTKQPAPAMPAPAVMNQAPAAAARAPAPPAPAPVVWSAEPPLVTKQPVPAMPTSASTEDSAKAARVPETPVPVPAPVARPVEPSPVVKPPTPATVQVPATAARSPEPPSLPVVWSAEPPPVTKQPAPVAPSAKFQAPAAESPVPPPLELTPPAKPAHLVPAVPVPAVQAPVVTSTPAESTPKRLPEESGDVAAPAPVTAPAPTYQPPAPAARAPAPPAPVGGSDVPPVLIQTALAAPALPKVAPAAAAAELPVSISKGPPAQTPPMIVPAATSPAVKPSTGGATASASISQPATANVPARSVERGKSPDRLQPEDLQAAPELVDDLIRGATGGATLNERRACIRALIRCRVKTPAALAALEELQNDVTPQVRVDAIIGLARLQMAP